MPHNTVEKRKEYLLRTKDKVKLRSERYRNKNREKIKERLRLFVLHISFYNFAYIVDFFFSIIYLFHFYELYFFDYIV